MGVEVLIPIMGILLVMIPVAGLTLGLTLRFAVRPMVETLANALQQARSPGGDQLGPQIALLQEEVESLSREVRELRSVQEFDRKLLARESDERHPSVVER
jgi:hypothetical protein